MANLPPSESGLRKTFEMDIRSVAIFGDIVSYSGAPKKTQIF